MEQQEYKLVKDGFETFYFAHSLKSAYERADEAYNKSIQLNKYNSVSLYRINENIGERWKLIKSQKKEVHL